MTDLDSFFAKKDKRKCGSKSEGAQPPTKPPGIKSITPVQIGRKLLEDCDVTRKNRCDSRGAEEEDDEWKPFDAEEKKDYSGLKIQALVLPDTDEVDPESADENRRQPNGPWKIADIPAHTEEPSGGTYVNPIQRIIGKRPEIGACHAAPDVKSNIVFPTLSEGLKGGTNENFWSKRDASRAEQNREAAKPVELSSITRNGPTDVFKQGGASRVISRNSPRNGVDSESGEISRVISRNGPRNTPVIEAKPTHFSRLLSRNGPRNTPAAEDSLSNPARLNRIPTNRLNTPKVNVRLDRENLNPTTPEGKLNKREIPSEPTTRVGKYLPPGLRQKFATQTGSTLEWT